MQDKLQMMQNLILEKQDAQHVEKMLNDIVFALDQSAIVSITDSKGTILYANELFMYISKYNLEELLGANQSIVNSGYHPKSFFKEMWQVISSGQTWRGDILNKRKDGSLYWVDTTIVPFLDDQKKPYQYISIRYDITPKKIMEEEVKKSTELYRLIAENSSDFITVINRSGEIKYLSPSYVKILGFTYLELMSQNFCSIVATSDQSILKQAIHMRGATIQNSQKIEFKVQAKSGEIHHMEATIDPITDSDRYYDDLVLVMRDITLRKDSERVIHDLAQNDQLTSLLNRDAFRKALYKVIDLATRHRRTLGLVIINIDKLRFVNETYGHEGGDILISTVAQRLKKKLGYNALIARISGDEFAFLLEAVHHEEDVKTLAKDVLQQIESPVQLGNDAYSPTFSMGITMYPQHARTVTELITKAELAVQNVKQRGGEGIELYQPGTSTKSLERLVLENELRKSVKRGYFTLDYQPKVKLSTGELTAYEALVRWNHPDLGRIPPNKFIPLAEETKTIVQLGAWVFREACKQVREWMNEGRSVYRTAINVSTVQLEDPNFIFDVKETLRTLNVPANAIEIELTESAFAETQEILENIEQLRALGMLISIDDFGTGYSTFSYIKDLPADTLKIDMSFVKDIVENENSQAIVKAIVMLADTAGLNVVAEGIETGQQARILFDLGCREGQGYFYGKPEAPDTAVNYVKKTIRMNNYSKLCRVEPTPLHDLQ